jgi:hypothetical protein
MITANLVNKHLQTANKEQRCLVDWMKVNNISELKIMMVQMQKVRSDLHIKYSYVDSKSTNWVMHSSEIYRYAT